MKEEGQLVSAMKETQEDHEEYIKQLENVLNMFLVASNKFITKVETGRARSVETYEDLKCAVTNAQNVLTTK